MSAGCSHTHRYAPSTLDTHTQFSCHGYWTTWSGVILVGRLRDRSVRSQSVSISFSKPPLRAALCCPLLPAHRTAAQQKSQCHRDWELLFLSRKLCNISTREHLRGDERTTRHGPPTADRRRSVGGWTRTKRWTIEMLERLECSSVCVSLC